MTFSNPYNRFNEFYPQFHELHLWHVQLQLVHHFTYTKKIWQNKHIVGLSFFGMVVYAFWCFLLPVFHFVSDVSLPAVFMPFKSGTIFNPRAHQYFHPPGSNEMRLSQPPSMLTLPPLPKNVSFWKCLCEF